MASRINQVSSGQTVPSNELSWLCLGLFWFLSRAGDRDSVVPPTLTLLLMFLELSRGQVSVDLHIMVYFTLMSWGIGRQRAYGNRAVATSQQLEQH